MGYEHCKHCDEHLIECNGGSCDWCVTNRISSAEEVAAEEAAAAADPDVWGSRFDGVAPDTPIRMWVRRDKKTGLWFARVNVGGWKMGESRDAVRESPTRAITAALFRVVSDDPPPYARDAHSGITLDDLG